MFFFLIYFQKDKSTKSTIESNTKHIFFLQFLPKSEVNQVNHLKLHNTYCFFFQFFCQKVKSTKSTIESDITHIFLSSIFFPKSEVIQVNHLREHTYFSIFVSFPQKVKPTKSTTGEIKHSRFFFGKTSIFFSFLQNKYLST